MKKVTDGEEFTLRYTDSAQAQLGALPFEVLSRVEGELERICREQDPMETGCEVEEIPSRRRYEITPVHVVAWVTRIDPDMRFLTVVEVVFPDQQAPAEAPCPDPPPVPGKAVELRRKPRQILYPLRRSPVSAEV